MSEPYLARIGPADERLGALYRDLLEPAFPTRQLDTEAELRDSVAEGTADVLASLDAEGRPVGVAVGEWHEDSRVQLLAYLAVAPDRRSAGIGGRLLETALARWAERHGPCLVVAEIEHPRAPAHRPGWGDPHRRYDFYARHGSRVLDLPFFQPALRAGGEREYGMLLLALHIDPKFRAEAPGRLAAGPVRSFLDHYFTETEGGPPGDPAGAALLAAAGSPEGIALLDPAATAVERLPRTVPPGASAPA